MSESLSKIVSYEALDQIDERTSKIVGYKAIDQVDLRISKLVSYVVLSPTMLASQIVAEVLVWNQVVTTPAIYPTLPGLGFSVIKRPKFFNGSAASGSGWQVRIGYASAPLWEIDLTYDVLSDESPQMPVNDFQTLVGFFLAQNADLIPFLLLDPDDNNVSGQEVAIGDGTTTTFTLYRTYGGASGTGTEPIGYVNLAEPFIVAVGGVVKTLGTDYTILSTTPCNQQIKFTTAPAASALIQVDMSYYFYVHFQASTNEFEKFMNQLWSVKKITLESLRG
jgi:hypothetical protein